MKIAISRRSLVFCLYSFIATGLSADPNCSAPPIAFNDDQPWPVQASTIQVLGNDYDPGGAALTIHTVSGGTGGTAVKTSDSLAVLFTPAPGATSGSFQYQARNAEGVLSSSLAVVTLSDSPPAQAPATVTVDAPLCDGLYCRFRSNPSVTADIRSYFWRFNKVIRNSAGQIVSIEPESNCVMPEGRTQGYACTFSSQGEKQMYHAVIYHSGEFVQLAQTPETIHITSVVPTVSLSVANDELDLDVEVRMHSSHPNPLNHHYRIAWGDGTPPMDFTTLSQTPNDAILQHTYSTEGTKTITITHLESETPYQTITNVWNKAPTPVLTVLSAQTETVHFDVQYWEVDEFAVRTAPSPHGWIWPAEAPQKWEIDFGDGEVHSFNPVGEIAGSRTVTHKYLPRQGTYKARLTVIDHLGAAGTTETEVAITNLTPTAVLTYSCRGTICQFDGRSSVASGQISSYYFLLERRQTDGSWTTVQWHNTPSGTYTADLVGFADGVDFRAHLTVSDDRNVSSATTTRYGRYKPTTETPAAFYAVEPCTLGSKVVTQDVTTGIRARGVCGIPNDTEVVAVAVNVRLSGALYAGWLSLEPAQTTTILNIKPEQQPQSNFMIVPVNSAGELAVSLKQFATGASASVRMDTVGYFRRAREGASLPELSGASVGPLWYRSGTPCLAFDTRTEGPALPGSSSRTFDLTGRCGMTGGEAAAFLQSTVISPTSQGSILARASDSPLPSGTVVSLEAVPGRNVSGAFVTKLSRGSFKMTTTSGAANVTVSSPGAFVRGEGLRFYATPPCILIDTRKNENGKTRLNAGELLEFQARGNCGISPDAEAVLLYAVVPNASSAGNVRVFPSRSDGAQYAAVNYVAAQYTPDGNSVVVPVGRGAEDVSAQLVPATADGTADLRVDSYGYFARRRNVAAATNGGRVTVEAGGTYGPLYAAAAIIDGDRRGVETATSKGKWIDNSPDTYPDAVVIEFARETLIDAVDVVMVHDSLTAPSEPLPADKFTQYGLAHFEVDVYRRDLGAWLSMGGAINNDRLWRRIQMLQPELTQKIRIRSLNAAGGRSQLVEVEAYEVPTGARRNVASDANGATVTVSSTYDVARFPPKTMIDGDRRGIGWGSGTGGWSDGTANSWPDDVQVRLKEPKFVDTIDIFTLQDNPTAPVEPSLSLLSTLYGVQDLMVYYDDLDDNVPLTTTVPSYPPGTNKARGVLNSNRVWTRLSFSQPIRIDTFWVRINRSLRNYSRIVEIEAWEASAGVSANISAANTEGNNQ